jgi:hypothetical protein
MTGFRHGRRVSLLALVVVGALFVSACGKPAYTYVANKDANTYFKVPSDWTKSDDTDGFDLTFARALFNVKDKDSQAFDTFKKVSWSVEYHSPPDFKAQLDGPLAYSVVAPVLPTFRGNISLDFLRDMLGDPVSLPARTSIISANKEMPRGFELLDDEVLTPIPGRHGVRVVYNLFVYVDQLGNGFVATYDLTALTNDDSSVLYALLLGCSVECYRKNAVKINDVVTSFTVRSAP